MSVASPTYPLRLPVSLKRAAERLAEKDGVSLNTFVAVAVAEKVSALTTEFFAERRRRADPDALLAILNREGGEPPRPGDELPPGFAEKMARYEAKPARRKSTKKLKPSP